MGVVTVTDPLLRPKEAALRLRKHEKSVRILCAAGKLRHVRTDGGRYLIPESAIDEYIRLHTVSRTA